MAQHARECAEQYTTLESGREWPIAASSSSAAVLELPDASMSLAPLTEEEEAAEISIAEPSTQATTALEENSTSTSSCMRMLSNIDAILVDESSSGKTIIDESILRGAVSKRARVSSVVAPQAATSFSGCD